MLTRDEIIALDGKVFLYNPNREQGCCGWTSLMDCLNYKWINISKHNIFPKKVLIDEGYELDLEWLYDHDPRDVKNVEKDKSSLIVNNTSENILLRDTEEELTTFEECGGVKSDGGSSSYYELTVNNVQIETEDIIRDVFGNDFDYGNAFKSLVRAYKTSQGKGKAGNDISYECNKIDYSVNKIRKQGEQ